jgi:ribosomal protein L7Ae-like RNA K-turn-binding protein
LDEGLADRVLRMIGLGVRSRGAVVGVERVREAAKKGTLALAVIASDASEHSASKVVPLLVARGVRVVHTASAIDLGHAVGREQTAAVGITDRQLAQGIFQLLDSAPESGQEGGRIE